MLRRTRQPVKVSRRAALSVVLFAAFALPALSGCYWRQYPRLMETHLSLLLDYGEKLRELAQDGEKVPPERWGEFTYPLERARDFARIARKRFPDRASLRDFDAAVERYAGLVADPRVLDGSDAAARVAAQFDGLRQSVETTRRTLAREQAGNAPSPGTSP
jgi:hypothetical protein